MREQELAQLEEHVRALEETNLAINNKLNAAHLADATTFTYYTRSSQVRRCLFSLFVETHS